MTRHEALHPDPSSADRLCTPAVRAFSAPDCARQRDDVTAPAVGNATFCKGAGVSGSGAYRRTRDRYPRRLSGGKGSDSPLARAIAREPQPLLDEPFRRSIAPPSAFCTSRSNGWSSNLADHGAGHPRPGRGGTTGLPHLCLIDRGRLPQAGPTREVLARPCCESAARLLDIPEHLRRQARQHRGTGLPRVGTEIG